MIDKDFIEKWVPKYVYSSKFKYSEILTRVQEDIQKSKIISKDTLEKMFKILPEEFNYLRYGEINDLYLDLHLN